MAQKPGTLDVYCDICDTFQYKRDSESFGNVIISICDKCAVRKNMKKILMVSIRYKTANLEVQNSVPFSELLSEVERITLEFDVPVEQITVGFFWKTVKE